MNAAPEPFTLPQLAHIAGVEYRMAHMWLKRGLLTPSVRQSKGTGQPNLFTEADVRAAERLVRLRGAGLSMAGLERAVKEPAALSSDLQEWL